MVQRLGKTRLEPVRGRRVAKPASRAKVKHPLPISLPKRSYSHVHSLVGSRPVEDVGRIPERERQLLIPTVVFPCLSR